MANRFARYTEPEGVEDWTQSTQPRNRFARYVSESPAPRPQAADMWGDSATEAFLSGASNSLSFGWGDEIKGAAAGVGAMLGGGDYSDAYRQSVEGSRQRLEHARMLNGGAFTGGEIAGALAPGLGAGALLRGAARLGGIAARAPSYARSVNPAARVALGAGLGAAGGGVYGAGNADPTYEDRIAGAGGGALWGAILGGGGQAVMEGAGRLLGGVGRGLSPQARAADYVARAAQRTGLDEAALQDEIARQARMGHGAMLMDAYGDAGTDLVMGAATRPSTERNIIRGALDQRNMAAVDDALDDVWSSLHGGRRVDPSDAVEALRARQIAETRPLYEAVDATRIAGAPDDIAEMMARNPDLFEAAQRRALNSVRSRHGAEIADDPRLYETMPFYWRRVNEEMNEIIESQRRAAGVTPLEYAGGTRLGEFEQVAGRFRSRLRDVLGDDFRRAQEIWSGDAQSQAAVRLGYDSFGPTLNELRLGEVTRLLDDMTPGQLEHFRLGVIAKMSNMIENADTMTGRVDALRSIMRSRGQRQILARVFGDGDGDALDGLLARLDHQRELFQNSAQTGIRVNSVTQDKAMHGASIAANAGGSWQDRIFRIFASDLSDAYDEKVADSILRLMRTPATEAHEGIQRAGGLRQWASEDAFARRAVDRMRARDTHRENALANVVLGAPFVANAQGVFE